MMTGDIVLMLSDAGDTTLVLMEFDPPLMVTRRRFCGGSGASDGERIVAGSRASLDAVSAPIVVGS